MILFLTIVASVILLIVTYKVIGVVCNVIIYMIKEMARDSDNIILALTPRDRIQITEIIVNKSK
jgi:hypothetical protein